MKKRRKINSVFISVILLTGCNISSTHTHTFSSMWSYDDTYHYHEATCEHKDIVSDKGKHTEDNEVIITPVSNEPGLARYTCSICNHTYEKVLFLDCEIIESPNIDNEVFIGQKLSEINLVNGKSSVEGSFVWKDANQEVLEDGNYEFLFIPNENDKYEVIESYIYIDATQLTISIEVGENGKASHNGVVNVNYNGELKVEFSPDNGYQVSSIIVDGETKKAALSYIFDEIKTSHTLKVLFEKNFSNGELPFNVNFVSGTNNAYTFVNNTLTFTSLMSDSVYQISGSFEGNIVIDVGDEYRLDLEMHGLTLTSSSINPITILSGNKVSLTAKKGYESFIYDNREAIDSTDTSLYSGAIYSLVDLEICGKGSLKLESINNNGIHSKDDLDVKNLSLSVTCVDNALKGNDSVTLENAFVTLISKKGDGIKTTNSDISTKGNQRGTISVLGGTYNIYAACDGLDAAYNVLVDHELTELNIYTDKYSPFSEEVTDIKEDFYYIRNSSNSYDYSVKYYNSDTDYKWVNAEYDTSTSNGRNTYYYYKFAKLSNYSKLAVYMYTTSQTQGQDSNYYACSSYNSINDSYDTLSVSYRKNELKINWTNYSTTSTPGGMQEGNSDKGDHSTKGIKASNEIIINNGKVYIKSYDDAIHANNDVALENGASPLGNVTINGGDITIYSNDDGIHADGVMKIVDGIINVTNSYEGIEGNLIYLQGGNISIFSLDDGINATGTSGTTISISGGTNYIYAKGDGIDSNSTTSYNGILFTGGNTVIICNSNGNSAIDSEKGYSYSGGKVVAITSSGGMSEESTKVSSFASIGTKKNLSLSTNSYVVVKVNSTVIVTIKMPCSLSSLAIYLGSSSASISSITSCNVVLDNNGVCWN